MSEQIAIRISDDMAESLEELVEHGRFETKADAVRTALQALVEAERRRRVGELIVAGYERIPQTDDEGLASATDAADGRLLHALEAEEDEAGLTW